MDVPRPSRYPRRMLARAPLPWITALTCLGLLGCTGATMRRPDLPRGGAGYLATLESPERAVAGEPFEVVFRLEPQPPYELTAGFPSTIEIGLEGEPSLHLRDPELEIHTDEGLLARVKLSSPTPGSRTVRVSARVSLCTASRCEVLTVEETRPIQVNPG